MCSNYANGIDVASTAIITNVASTAMDVASNARDVTNSVIYVGNLALDIACAAFDVSSTAIDVVVQYCNGRRRCSKDVAMNCCNKSRQHYNLCRQCFNRRRY
jgi:hypothetical protein